MTRKRKLAAAIGLFLLAIGSAAYWAADRYLIEHVQAVVAPAASTQPASTSSAGSQPVYDDWSYKDDTVSVQIAKKQSGEGADLITYYVADVTVADSADLRTALAKNKFGLNITEDTSAIASAHDAIFAVNGDYYGFRKDGVIIRGGVLYRDEPARDALAVMKNGALRTYDEKTSSSTALLADGATNTFSFGPILVKDGQAAGDFASVKIDTNFGNRTIQGANPRTGIGMIAPNHYVFIVVDGRMKNYSKGMTLAEFADLFVQYGCTDAYNLDGGGSSTMYFMGRVVNEPSGKGEERGVSDIIYVGHQ
ncbi:phosphodiester glycosidase family protein [Paenibacillus cymbidii]|uniref:phosphodiester glycosidase family protein n=1 Tax=Paenibacillus cymbidii TaxID=1639034 RepID=UPI001080DF06|nr:phosphodiester glycosidase family protein [Paenibacillus cymbidii]